MNFMDVVDKVGPTTALALAFFFLLRENLRLERKERSAIRDFYRELLDNHIRSLEEKLERFTDHIERLIVELRRNNNRK